MGIEMKNIVNDFNGNSNSLESEVTVEFTYNYKNASCSAKLKVAREGNPNNKYKMITIHNVGLNASSNFSPLLSSEFMQSVMDRFCVYHIILPGQEDGAKDLGHNFVYPSMDHLAEALPKVLQTINVKRAIFMGDGVGANILMRFAMNNSTMIDGLVLVNSCVTTKSNLTWLGEKLMNINTAPADKLMNYLFSPNEQDRRPILYDAQRQHMVNVMNMNNIQMLFAEYERRSEIAISRPYDPRHMNECTLNCESLVMVGDYSPFLDDVVETNSRLNPEKTHFLKMAEGGGLLLEEEPCNVAEAILLFLQGFGLLPNAKAKKMSTKNSGDACVLDETKIQAVGRSSAYSTSINFNNRNLDEVIAVNPGEKAPLIQGINC